jgi:hypothetical protein
MTTSGQFAHSLTNHTVLPGDVFRLENAVGRYTKARVIFVGVDYRSSARHEGKVVLTVQPVIDGSELRVDKFPGLQVRSRELLLIDAEFEVREADIRHPYVVHMDWSWDGRSTSMPQLAPDGYFIRQIINLEETWRKRADNQYGTRTLHERILKLPIMAETISSTLTVTMSKLCQFPSTCFLMTLEFSGA